MARGCQKLKKKMFEIFMENKFALDDENKLR
jgi:hypothetical protein